MVSFNHEPVTEDILDSVLIDALAMVFLMDQVKKRVDNNVDPYWEIQIETKKDVIIIKDWLVLVNVKNA